MKDAGNIKDAADAVKGIVEAIPIYQDAFQPAAKEIGIGLQTVAKTLHIVLAPIAGLVWGYDRVKEFVQTRVAEKLRNVPIENIATPEPHVVVPALIALSYTAHQENLRELYANLLATSLDSRTCELAHPAFVDIIKNLSPDEARIMRLASTKAMFPVIEVRNVHTTTNHFSTIFHNFSSVGKEAGCDHPAMTPAYLNNLCRLGLLDLPGQGSFGMPTLTAPNTYEPLENDEEIIAQKKQVESVEGHQIQFRRGMVLVTSFGRQFCQACVIEKE